ncbi:AraC family transcriptional regulator [Streptomyces sp. SX92]|uniref:AraC family transcriptional regulator n=1 Tax=Streptomyces sp. SX92 TaxID=3158972 RepID=UPI0027B95329|nr:helix-turn-helix transcriptional regulator [Streptomyces coralus]WLW50824.1 helix-turn-helix transcriptional regulator [Streptomyces coralus]
MERFPWEIRDRRFSFTDGTMAYAGRHLHDPTDPAYRAGGLHTHSFMEVAVVTGGVGVHVSQAGSQPVHAGDVILLRPGVWHGYRDFSMLDIFNCCFSVGLLHRELAWTREDPLLGYLLWTAPYAFERRGMLTMHLNDAALAECVAHLDALAALRFRSVDTHRSDIVGRLSMFLGALAREVTGDGDSPGAAGERAGPAHPAVIHAMQLMEGRPEHRWTLGELASESHITPRYLVRIFKSATGVPPLAYLSQHRVEIAASLLLHTDQSVAQIATAVGWPDPNYFARRFRSHFGLSPSTYRSTFSQNAVRLGSGTVISGRSVPSPTAMPRSRR